MTPEDGIDPINGVAYPEGPKGLGDRRDGVRVTKSLTIPADEIRWRATTSGGPGGQHANRRSTRVEVSFDISSSPSLGPRQRARLLERFGPTIVASASESRSQARNRALALERLGSRLAAALHRPPARRATVPSKAARQRRLNDKRRRSELKRSRRSASDD